MKIQTNNELLAPAVLDAVITSNHAASSYGLPVLMIDGEAVGTLEAKLAGYRILEATEAEHQALQQGGYSLAQQRRDSEGV